ncbi:cAMP-dependent protein kinase catalytic subunit pkaC [Aspergillus fischeri NRRL 181]|uniref:cAMP-dependent protein kinase n=1 Tax=Neosartorya fischeri (strain ATCC 1020 / DSM 3700 / CBS 544.65 / FGSC A1164 / JCM 1740 / NRRL 181 / WB 181) TaxID=331117 RepID=A1DHC5_NEOFI|nr:cAMP-dependent protein kinase catalytic subunit PkaC1 [Aspergillus fischeri NRRL 181]EAW18782.1 cAMP-dependent protein kinase catalytic subunit PkaC1 [Aspergillus fischeri NRRL 181]
MPTLGGLLKKRRTKDSHTLSKELESSSSPTAAQTQTSPNSADHDHHNQHNDQTHHHQHSASSNTSNNSATPSAAQLHRSSNDNPNRSSGTDQNSEGPTASMQSAVTQPHPSTHHNSGLHHLQHQQQQPQQQHSHTSRLHNILHPSHHASQASAEGYANSQQANRAEARTTKGKYSLDDFTIQRTLGTGSFGRVHLVQSKHNHRFYAIKVLKKAQVVKMKQVEHTNDERRMLNRVRHPFLITLWGTWQDARNLYMVMDFVEGGELFSLLRKSQRFPNPVAKFYAAEVTLALEYLHSQQIIYRDLKPENLLLDRHGHLKITDFGFAKEVPDITWTLCGTPDYLAPEVVSSKGYNKSVDWWSLGILIFEMLCGFTPFWDSGSPVKIYENILRGRVKYPPYLHPDAVDLLSQLITADLTKRLGNLHGGSEDVKNHPWFAEVTWDRLARKDIDAPYVPPIRGGQGDASQYDRYPEETEQYGQQGEDVHGHLFPDF